jgi:hypothetical protein
MIFCITNSLKPEIRRSSVRTHRLHYEGAFTAKFCQVMQFSHVIAPACTLLAKRSVPKCWNKCQSALKVSDGGRSWPESHITSSFPRWTRGVRHFVALPELSLPGHLPVRHCSAFETRKGVRRMLEAVWRRPRADIDFWICSYTHCLIWSSRDTMYIVQIGTPDTQIAPCVYVLIEKNK